MIKKTIAPLLIAFLTIFLIVVGGNNIAPFIDIQSLLYVFLVGVIFFIASPLDRFSAFGDGCVYAGWLAFLIGLIFIFYTINDADTALIGPAFGINFLALLYGYFFKVITLPLKSTGIKNDKVVKEHQTQLSLKHEPFKPSGKIKSIRPIKKKI